MSDNLIPERVYIQYAVDFKEVPDSVSHLLRELAGSFGTLSRYLREASEEVKETPVQTLGKMKELDSLTQKASVRIKDCSEILSNYIEIIKTAASIEIEKRSKPSTAESLDVARSVTTLVRDA